MKTSLYRCARSTIGVASLVLVFVAGSALADFSLPGGPLFVRKNYDYAPSVIQDGHIQEFWWCGRGTVPKTKFITDVIYHRQYDKVSRKWTGITKVLWPTRGQWDGYYVCDPSVVRGEFFNPDNGRTYSHAMYYTATDIKGGENNRIGLAFSNDGTAWEKYSAPVIYPQVGPTSQYGAGQAASYNADGKSHVYIFHTDTSTTYGTRMWVRESSDGRTFGPPTLLSKRGAQLNANSDFAYDRKSQSFYAAISLPGRVGDRDTLGFVLARMPAADLLNGRGTWENLGTINSNLTGYYLNHSPGLLRDQYGNLTRWLPAVGAYFAAGNNSPKTWNLTWAIWDPDPSTLPFARYYNSTSGYHKVTTGYVDPGFSFERTLGYLFMAPLTGTSAVYGCHAGMRDFFVSLDRKCEGQLILGVNGWLYSTPQPRTQALYRCYSGVDHFVSKDPACEGKRTEKLLGYARRTAD